MGARLGPSVKKMDVFQVLIVLLCRQNVNSAAQILPKAQQLFSGEVSTINAVDHSKQHDAHPASTADGHRLSSKTSQTLLDRKSNVYEGFSLHTIKQTTAKTTGKRTHPIATNDNLQLLPSFSTEAFAEGTGNMDILNQHNTRFSPTSNTMTPPKERPVPSCSSLAQHILTNKPSTISQTKDEFDTTIFLRTTGIGIEALTTYPSSLNIVSTTPYLTSIEVSATKPLSEKFRERNDFLYMFSKLNISICRSSCSHLSSNETMICTSDLPCEIPISVNRLEFVDADYTKLVDEYHFKNNLALFSKITHVTLNQTMHLDSSSFYEFLLLFPSLHTTSFVGDIPLQCAFFSQTSRNLLVRHVYGKMCAYQNIHLSLESMHCFPNLTNLVIEKRFAYCSPYSKYRLASSNLVDLSALRFIAPELTFIKFDLSQFDDTISIYDDCDGGSFEKIVIIYPQIWHTRVTFISECELVSIELIDSNWNSDHIFPVNPSYINIIGSQTVVFLLNLNSCIPHTADKLYAQIIFSFGSHLLIHRHCNNKSLEMSITHFNKRIMEAASLFHFIELSYDGYTNFAVNLSSLDFSYFLLHEGNGGRIMLAEHVLLSNNHLGIMAEKQSNSFEKILHAFTKLKVVDLAINGIKELPVSIFDKSIHLEIILLSNNKLSALRLEQFRNLPNLTTLDLSDNHIRMIGVSQLHAIISFLSPRNCTSINMLGNVRALKCMCSDFESFISLVDFIDNETFIVSPHCETKLNVVVHIPELESYCWSQKMMLIHKSSLPIAIGLTVVGLVIVVIVLRIRKRKRLINKFVNGIKQGHAKKEFLLFLSYSSDDGEMVYRLILPEIARRILEKTGVDKEHICTGDTHFIPGFNIIQEAMRCINICSVVVFVMTKSFVRSPFCRMEVKEALDQAKPIILMMKEKIDPNKMPKIIRNIFYKYSRFHFIRGRHDVRVLPSWDLLVSAIFNLAANEEKDLKCLEKLEHGDQDGARRIDEIEMLDIK